MTLADLTLPLPYEQARQYALIFSSELAARLLEVQQEHGSPIHRASPAMLADGRYLLYGDCLTECVPGGILWGGFSRLDAGRFGEIEVMPVAEAESLLPPAAL
jgi:hypothetical protein